MMFYLKLYDSSFYCDIDNQRTKGPCDLYLSICILIHFSAVSFLDLGLPFIASVGIRNF